MDAELSGATRRALLGPEAYAPRLKDPALKDVDRQGEVGTGLVQAEPVEVAQEALQLGLDAKGFRNSCWIEAQGSAHSVPMPGARRSGYRIPVEFRSIWAFEEELAPAHPIAPGIGREREPGRRMQLLASRGCDRLPFLQSHLKESNGQLLDCGPVSWTSSGSP